MEFLTTIPVIALFLIVLGAWVFFHMDAHQDESMSGEIYPKQWNRKKKWVVTVCWVTAVVLYFMSFIYGVVNVLESGDPLTKHHLYHLALGSVIIYLLLSLLFFFIGASVMAWGVGLKAFYIGILASAVVMVVIALGLYLLMQTFSLSNVFLWLLSSLLISGVSVVSVSFLLYFLYSRQ